MKLLIDLLIRTVSLIILSRILPGIHVSGFGAAFVAVIVIGFANALIKPFLVLLTLPLTIVTLGLFSFVVNGFVFAIAGSLSPGFTIDSLGTAVLGSIVFSILNSLLFAVSSGKS